jgi:hypothetical protein
VKSKASAPIVIVAVIGLVVILVIMGKMFLKGPDTVTTAPPPWIDAATGKPKAQMSGSGTTAPEGGTGTSGNAAPSAPGR